jgi:nitrogen-specific signal transduction histidine kinase/ActR/RegA family two-component response regulator
LLRPDNNTPHGAVAVFSDVTEERVADERLRQSQTLEAVGQLAGGIAHDFNNLLTVIRGATGFMSDALGETSVHAEDLKAIERATERAEELTRRLLAVGRKQMLRRARVDLNALVREETEAERLRVPEGIVLRHAFSLVPAVALLDRTPLLDAVAVLVRNAIAAMPDGGVLTIGTDVQSRERATGPGQDATNRRYAVLIVADTGVGMPDAVKARLFEPFFSTQPFGTGRGMDLASVHGMVAQSDGFIECDSEPGNGTTLRLFFPEAAAFTASQTPRAVRIQPAAGRRVLVVDDDPLLRAVTRRMLEKLDYPVIVADSGHQALELLDGSPMDFALLVTDLTMPNMSGMSLIEHVQRRRPTMPIVAISGFALDSQVRDALAAKQIRFVPKPFTADELSHAVERALAMPAA